MQISNCYNCRSEQCTFYAEENGYELVKCRGCGLLYVKQRPDDLEIKQSHKQGRHSGLYQLNVTGVFNQEKVTGYTNILEDMYGGDFGNKTTWLDVGCGHGEFMVALQQYSKGELVVKGTEPNIHKQESARKRYLNVGYFDLDEHVDKYDAISLLNVYSHIPNPPSFLASLKKNLHPGGELILETGDTANLSADDHYRPFFLPDHLSFASESIVTDILRRLEFEIISVHKYCYPNTLNWSLGPRTIVKELVKIVLPGYMSRAQDMYQQYRKRHLYSQTDMYIRASLKT